MRELRAAGITDPALQESYLRCRALNSQHGRTYYLATLLLPPAKRPFVHALYGFARYADEIVDDLVSTASAAEKTALLTAWGDALFDDLRAGGSADPIRMAVVDTALRWDIPAEHFRAFLDSMAMDLTVTEYQTFADLRTYVYGSAAVIGLQMLPILEPAHPDAAVHAEQLGVAFQLANFIRDVGEDLLRGRVYLPLADLARFGVTRADLEQRVVTPAVRAALQFQIARVRGLERAARPGIAMLHPSTRDCIDTARILYCGIVDEVERIDYDVFARRASTSAARRARVAVPRGLHAVGTRYRRRQSGGPAVGSR